MGRATARGSHQKGGEVDARVDRELERSPHAAVDLHQVGRARGAIDLELDHREPAPGEVLEQAVCLFDELLVGGGALRIDAASARGWILAKSAM